MDTREKSPCVAGPSGVLTPDTSHVGTGRPFPNVYEPAEDTFLLLDALQKDIAFLLELQPTIVLEMGSGSGCVTSFLRRLLRSEQQQRQQQQSSSLLDKDENYRELQQRATAPPCGSIHAHSADSSLLADPSARDAAPAAAAACTRVPALPSSAAATAATERIAPAVASCGAEQTQGDDAAAGYAADSVAAAGPAGRTSCMQRGRDAAASYLPVFVAVDLNWEAAAATLETSNRADTAESATACPHDSSDTSSSGSGSRSSSSGSSSGSSRGSSSGSSSGSSGSSSSSGRSSSNSSSSGSNSGSSGSSGSYRPQETSKLSNSSDIRRSFKGGETSSSNNSGEYSGSGTGRFRRALPGVVEVLVADMFTSFRCLPAQKPARNSNSSSSGSEKREADAPAGVVRKERAAFFGNIETGLAAENQLSSSSSRTADEGQRAGARAAHLQQTKQQQETETGVSPQQQRHLQDVHAASTQEHGQQNALSLFDVILFNPPYVPGEPHEERPPAAADWAWWGGKNGREVIDRFLAEAPAYLTLKGALYLVLEKRNCVDEVVTCMKDRNFVANCILQRKIHGGEHLSVWRFTRVLS